MSGTRDGNGDEPDSLADPNHERPVKTQKGVLLDDDGADVTLEFESNV